LNLPKWRGRNESTKNQACTEIRSKKENSVHSVVSARRTVDGKICRSKFKTEKCLSLRRTAFSPEAKKPNISNE